MLTLLVPRLPLPSPSWPTLGHQPLRCLREVVGASSLEMLRIRLDGTLSSLVWVKMSLLMAEGWTREPLKVPSHPNHSTMVWAVPSACGCPYSTSTLPGLGEDSPQWGALSFFSNSPFNFALWDSLKDLHLICWVRFKRQWMSDVLVASLFDLGAICASNALCWNVLGRRNGFSRQMKSGAGKR